MRSRVRMITLSLLLAVLSMAACDSSTDPGPTYRWSADLSGIGAYDELEGTVDIEATGSVFNAEIEIAGAPADETIHWRIHAGTCASPGDAIGSAASYEALETDEQGGASASAVVSASLDEEDDYHARLQSDDTTPVTVACADLDLT